MLIFLLLFLFNILFLFSADAPFPSILKQLVTGKFFFSVKNKPFWIIRNRSPCLHIPNMTTTHKSFHSYRFGFCMKRDWQLFSPKYATRNNTTFGIILKIGHNIFNSIFTTDSCMPALGGSVMITSGLAC